MKLSPIISCLSAIALLSGCLKRTVEESSPVGPTVVGKGRPWPLMPTDPLPARFEALYRDAEPLAVFNNAYRIHAERAEGGGRYTGNVIAYKPDSSEEILLFSQEPRYVSGNEAVLTEDELVITGWIRLSSPDRQVVGTSEKTAFRITKAGDVKVEGPADYLMESGPSDEEVRPEAD